MSSRDDSLLYDTLLEARRIGRFVQGMDRPAFDDDEARRYAVRHAITLFGEAAYHVSSERPTSYPEIPWAKIIGMRHRLVHGYGDVDYDIVWDVTTRDVPALVPKLEKVVGAIGAEGASDDERS